VYNLLPPDRMSAAERCEEISHLLARGFLRYQSQIQRKMASSLDLSACLSHSFIEPTSTGENER
jgi:hypothetical protein